MKCVREDDTKKKILFFFEESIDTDLNIFMQNQLQCLPTMKKKKKEAWDTLDRLNVFKYKLRVKIRLLKQLPASHAFIPL